MSNVPPNRYVGGQGNEEYVQYPFLLVSKQRRQSCSTFTYYREDEHILECISRGISLCLELQQI